MAVDGGLEKSEVSFMGEYYNWVNVDRKEFICPADFDYGNKSHESSHRESDVLRALRDLLDNEWKGCRVFWMGDECSIPEKIAPELFSLIAAHCAELGYDGDMFDTVCESYKNVSGLYKTAEKMVREEIGYFLEELASGNNDRNEYGIDPENPFDGLFQREGKDFKYIINHTKKVCYSFEKTRILYQNGDINEYTDPLPILLGYGRVMEPGAWLGDVVGASDVLPEDVAILESITLDW